VGVMEGHDGPVTGCRFSPDGAWVVSASTDKTLKLWDSMSQSEVLTFSECKGRITACDWSPDGRMLISGGWEKESLKTWDVRSGALTGAFPGHFEGWDGLNACGISPDGRRIVSGGDDAVLRISDARTGEAVLAVPSGGIVSACAFSPDGRHVAATGESRSLRIWEATSGEEVACLTGQLGLASACAIGPDGRRVALGDTLGQLLVCSIENLRVPALWTTAVRLRVHHGEESDWDRGITAACGWCGQRSPVADRLLDLVQAIGRNAGLTEDQAPCRELPDEAWDEPGLKTECALCHAPLRFNPFMVDNRQ
jgi:WD40 repeat protein